MTKIKAFFKSSKLKALALLTMVFSAMASLTVFAFTDPPANSIDVAAEMGSAMGGLTNQIFGVLLVVLPVALTIVGAVIAIRAGIRLVRNLVGGSAR
jgi:hypothetical protein